MKRQLITILLALLAVAGQAKTYKTIKAPKAMACANVSGGELKAREVIMRDTATTVRFTMEYKAGKNFRFAKDSYLMDEDGNRYPLRSVEGIGLDRWITSPESGTTDFTMHFEPLPKKTKMFDFIEGDSSGAFMLLGIHSLSPNPSPKGKGSSKSFPLGEDLGEAGESWLNTDTICIKGRIEGYDAERFGFTSLECYFQDVFEKDATTLVLDIADDGTFCKKFQASYPIYEVFYTYDSKVGFDELPFFARPGETIDITVKKNEGGQWECFYNSGSSKEVERWLKSKHLAGYISNRLSFFEGTFSEAQDVAEEVWQDMMLYADMESRRSHFTPMEAKLELADVQVSFATAMMDYAMEIDDGVRRNVDGVYNFNTIVDSVEWRALLDMKSYAPLRHVDFDNPLLLMSRRYDIVLNRIENARAVVHRRFNGESGYSVTAENMQKQAEIALPAYRELMSSDKDNMMAQLCIYKDMQSLTSREVLSEVFPFYRTVFTHPYVRQKAEQYYADKMAQTELATPLPDVPAADIIRSLSAKYPGRFLIIDFWQMGCGPCRAAIQQSKDKRTEIRKRDDVKFVFICGERTAEGSEAYHKYVDEWLAGEETVCVTYQDFTRLQELFRFNGIPHLETITPDCRRLRDDMQFQGFHNISGLDGWLNWLKKRLE
ncbi:MAG: hypothetical protein IJT11_07625 [Bacteroidaceae bacterium]|nr:hypothetical protein [Bacteroidaceae bacterium]